MNNILISKDSKNKIRVVEISYKWSDEKHGYVINRTTYQFGGKKTNQPEIWVFRGKVKRTVTEQVELEYNSHVKKYKDKGYKEFYGNIDTVSIEELHDLLPIENTDNNGALKPMLAIQHDKVAVSNFEKDIWYGSRKIDGVRASIFLKDGELKTSSRGGTNYDFALRHILEHPTLIEFFENNPDLVLDGEVYKHGWSLQKISGKVRTIKDVTTCTPLEFWVYDIVDVTKPFIERLETLECIKEELNLNFDYEKEFADSDLKLRIVPHDEMSGWTSLKHYHDIYVTEGFEGLIIRNKNKEYGVGKRSATYMIKIKLYQDAEFTITGFSEGLREEDMVFDCITDDGKPFKAKPMGSREIKQQYRKDMTQLIGKKATIKFFYYSEDNIPLQPVLKAIRDYDE